MNDFIPNLAISSLLFPQISFPSPSFLPLSSSFSNLLSSLLSLINFPLASYYVLVLFYYSYFLTFFCICCLFFLFCFKKAKGNSILLFYFINILIVVLISLIIDFMPDNFSEFMIVVLVSYCQIYLLIYN